MSEENKEESTQTSLDNSITKDLLTTILANADLSLERVKDGKIFQMAYEDFSNYLIYKNINLDEITKEDMELWVRIWQCKFRQRTKLLFNEADEKRIMPIDKPKPLKELPLTLTPEETSGLEELVKFTLLAKGELCGINILAKEFTKRVIRAYLEDKKIDQPLGEEERTRILVDISLRLTRECRSASEVTSSPLIYIRVDKKYYH